MQKFKDQATQIENLEKLVNSLAAQAIYIKASKNETAINLTTLANEVYDPVTGLGAQNAAFKNLKEILTG